jgi:hypothetical protein
VKVACGLKKWFKSLFYPWRVTSPRAAAKRLDRTLSAALRALGKGRDEEDVLRMLRPIEHKVPTRARPHYNLAVARLQEAAGRDWGVDREARARALEEGEKALLMTRAEALRAVVG